MKKFLIITILLCVTFSSWAQFRRRDRNAAQQPAENNLNYANPREYIIAGIDVSGINVLDKNAMISISGLKVGDKIKIPGDAITGAIRKIWKYGLVGDVTIEVSRIEGENIYLNIELAERSRLTAFYFTGVNKSQESGLKEDLNLIRGKIVNDAMIRNTELAVKKYFVKKGFLRTDVKVVQEKDTLNRDGIRLKIAINTKSKIKINKISFTGNEHIDDATLKRRMKKTKEHPRFTLHRTVLSALLQPGKYVRMGGPVSRKDTKEFLNDNIKLNIFSSSKLIQTDYEDDKKKIIAFYNSKGYRDAEIVTDSIYNHNDKTINIDFKIYEGPKYYFRNIIWTGNYIYTDKQLSTVLGISKGDVYNKELIDKKLQFNPKGMDISGLYMDDGYLFFRINPVEVAVAGDSIDVEMRIHEGEQATINEVTITGNDRTSDHVIRRELSTIPGQKFRRSDIIRTQQSLAQLGYFAPDKVSQNLVPNPDKGTVDVEWQVEEQSNDQVELSGGWGGYYGFVGTLGLTFNNFSVRNIPNFKNWRPLPVGDGQRLSLRVQANGRQYQSYSFSFTEPWLGGRKPHSFSVSLNSSVQRLTRYQTTDGIVDPSIKVNSVTVGLGRRLEWPDNYFTLTNSLSYLRYSLNDYNSGLGFTNGNANSINFNTTIARRSLNEIMYPSQGSDISLSITLTPPYSLWREIDYNTANAGDRFKWIEFNKWMFDAKYYLPLDNKKKLVLEAKSHFGFIGSYTSKAGIGPFERFYLGGDGLAGGFNSFLLGQEVIGLRGYENNRITPPDYNNYSTSNASSEIQGGIVYDKFGLELRYPVTTGSAATIYGFVFTEAGNNWNTYEDFNPFTLYKSAGFGARIFMPAFGLIGLNWGYGFDTLPGATQRSGAHFHFTIGQQIR
ncbi:BamA/OMP85 family outer membrane protein [Chryseosolibacter indicus]|uniref:BamA/TamA family outer membrane protein n=1 Tax=Chryseosolibacter indicus TaxID=2782351 RepID=A0ABS5VYT2_9BACT|nr:POTRA domain-containing protein [Chryseosolibacter indicus]MBT1706010.1 BamA/TamA family outer membrane protein [Chryseosolibacter indicus]